MNPPAYTPREESRLLARVQLRHRCAPPAKVECLVLGFITAHREGVTRRELHDFLHLRHPLIAPAKVNRTADARLAALSKDGTLRIEDGRWKIAGGAA